MMFQQLERAATGLCVYSAAGKDKEDMGRFGLFMSDEEMAFKLQVESADKCAELQMDWSEETEFSQYTEADAVRALRFILNYAEVHGVGLRGIYLCRAPCDDISTRKLPLSCNKITVWRFYKAAVKKIGERVVDLSNFRKMWKSFLPQVVIRDPPTAQCMLCHSNGRLSLHPMPDRMKLIMKQEQLDHIEHVKQGTEFIHNMNAECGRICEDSQLSLGPNTPASRKITMSYSFDYAQQVHYPSDPQQPGPMYFLIPRKCLLFGVCCGGMPKQVSYLIDEGMFPRKATSNFINYLHHFFNNYGVGEMYVNLNSSEGNRTNLLLWYCAWRTWHGLHLKIDLHFRFVGHDMSGPDWLFGLFRQAFRKTRVQTLSDIAGVVRDSTPEKQLNIPQLVGLEDGTVLVETYDWDQYLNSYYRKCPSIESYRHFSFDKQRPGMVIAKEHPDGEPKSFELMTLMSPPPIHCLRAQPPPGLSLARRTYLFKNIREFCSAKKKNITCPQPKDSDVEDDERCGEDGIASPDLDPIKYEGSAWTCCTS